MTSLKYSLALVIWSVIVCEVRCQCLTEDTEDWDPVSPDAYDMSYSPITNVDARPLGFKTGSFSYNKQQGTCVNVAGTSNRKIEVKVEAIPPTTICIRGNGNEKCSEADGRITLCQRFGGVDTIRFEFFCNAECAEGDVAFWYRIVVSPVTIADDIEQWCWARGSKYPGDLLQLDFVVTTEERQVRGSADAPQPCSLFTSLLAVLAVACCTLM